MHDGNVVIDNPNAASPHDSRVQHQQKVIHTLLEQVPVHKQVSFLHRLRNDSLKRIERDNQATEADRQVEADLQRRYNRQIAELVIRDEKSEAYQRQKARRKNTMILFFLSAASVLVHLTYFTNDPGHPYDGAAIESIILLGVGALGFAATLGITAMDHRLREKECQAIEADLWQENPESPHIILAAIDSVLAAQFR